LLRKVRERTNRQALVARPCRIPQKGYDVHKPRDGRTAAETIDAGEIIQRITDPETGNPIATIRRLPGGLLAVDVEGDDALAHHLLPPTQTGVATSASGTKKYRFIYRDTTSGGVS
jgi:hypothetical protein